MPTRPNRRQFLAAGAAAALPAVARAADPPATVLIGSRLELMADAHLIEKLTGNARHVLHHPTPREVAITHDAAWEGSGSNYHTVFRDGDLYRMYYRGAQFTIAGGKLKQDHPQVTCYAESTDGVRWTKPKLGLIEFNGSKENNIVWAEGRATHNFAPFKDAKPGVPKDGQYKALAGSPKGGGLAAFASADGVRWRLLSDKPVITKGAFDSQNLAFWDPVRKAYRAYWRDFRDGVRDIRTATSKDFLTWTEGEWLEYGDAPREQLYTNQVQPYYRAPHLLIGLPTRYVDRGWSPAMKALPEAEHRAQRAEVQRRYGTALTDTLLMTSRDGRAFRRWGEAFIRPGPERPGAWNYGHLYTACGMVETAAAVEGMPDELSLYATEGAWTGKSAQLRRYTLRVDGFASVHAGVPGGEMRTRLLTFEGKELVLNLATSTAGSIRVAVYDAADRPVPGFTLDDCDPVFGDSLERAVTWKGNADVSKLAGRPNRLRFALTDADLYSIRFR